MCVVPAQILNQVTLINIKDITVKYGEHIVLDKVSLDVAPGEIVTIVGPNGSGKTSLVKTIIGALKYDSGSLIVKNNLRIGYIPQRLNICLLYTSDAADDA